MQTQTRKSVVWQQLKEIQIVQKPIPKPGPGEVLLKVESCAICGSDIRIFNHGNPRVAAGQTVGHEISGKVVEIGQGVEKFKVGDNIAVGADVPCGECNYCRSGISNCCEINYAIGHQFEGGFSEYILLNKLTVDLGPVHKFTSSINFDEAALAEPLACCINGFEVGLMSPGKTVVIFGAGPIGLMLATLAPTYGAREVIMVDPNTKRLAVAAQMGVEHTIDPTQANPVELVKKITGGIGAGMVLTACPSVETHKLGIEMLSKRGVINLFGGLPAGTPPIPLSSNFIHYKEAYVTGSHGSTTEQHRKALEMIQSGKINMKPFITHHFNIDEISQAYDMATSGQAIKVIVKPGE